jgi:short-subunit dehydrogenase
VSSNFQARAGIKAGFEHQMMNVSASRVAQAGYRGLMANKRIVLPGLGMKIIPSLLRFFPRAFILAAIGRIQLRNCERRKSPDAAFEPAEIFRNVRSRG